MAAPVTMISYWLTQRRHPRANRYACCRRTFANAALRAGINILLKHAGLAAEDLERVLLAGAFGNYVRRENALRIGMLPPVPIERIHFVGNAASLGAKRFLLSADEAHAAAHIARNTVHLDLSLDPEFQDEFGAAMLFPGI